MIGSNLWSTMRALFDHLAKGSHGLSGEMADIRRDLNATLTPLLAVTVEEYDTPPPALPTAIMLVTATVAAAQTLLPPALTGATGGGVISPPRNITVTIAGTTPTDAPASVTINGLDALGKPLSETISGTNAGAATYSGVKCFKQVLSIFIPAALATDATMSIGTGSVIGLSQLPLVRTLQPLPLIRREVVDGAVVTTGVLTLPTTNPPYGAYTPASAPATAGPAVTTGTADITQSALYGSGGTLNGTSLVLNVNGAGALTLALSGTGNAASESALLAAIVAEWPTLTAVQGGTGGNKLVLTTLLQGVQASIVVTANAAATALGISGTSTGTGHRYAYEYEFDASQIPNA